MFDQYLMGINDVTPNNVVTELNNFAPQNTTSIKYKAGDQEYDIIIKDKRLAEKKEEENQDPVRTLEDLRNMQVTNTNNSLTELRSFSNINLTRGQGNINRVNQDKEITVNYRFNSDVNESKNILEAARTEIDELVQNTDIPTGIAVEVVHEEDENQRIHFSDSGCFCDHLHDPGVCFRITYSPDRIDVRYSPGCHRFLTGLIVYQQFVDECQCIDRCHYPDRYRRQQQYHPDRLHFAIAATG